MGLLCDGWIWSIPEILAISDAYKGNSGSKPPLGKEV